MSSSCNLTDYSPQGSSVHGISQARTLGWIAIASPPGDIPSQGSKRHLLRLLHWQADSFTTEPPGKPPWHIVGAPKTSVHWMSLALSSVCCLFHLFLSIPALPPSSAGLPEGREDWEPSPLCCWDGARPLWAKDFQTIKPPLVWLRFRDGAVKGPSPYPGCEHILRSPSRSPLRGTERCRGDEHYLLTSDKLMSTASEIQSVRFFKNISMIWIVLNPKLEIFASQSETKFNICLQ